MSAHVLLILLNELGKKDEKNKASQAIYLFSASGLIVGEPSSEKCKPLHPKGIQLNLVWLQR